MQHVFAIDGIFAIDTEFSFFKVSITIVLPASYSLVLCWMTR